MKIVNLTPHEIVVYRESEIHLRIQSSGFVRASQVEKEAGQVNGIPLKRVAFGKVQEMPQPEKDTVFVVSQITANALKEQGRTEDILITNDAVRDDAGKIIGCRSFAKV